MLSTTCMFIINNTKFIYQQFLVYVYIFSDENEYQSHVILLSEKCRNGIYYTVLMEKAARRA